MTTRCTIGSDDQGRRTYLIPEVYTDEDAERFRTALCANVLTAKVEFHHRRMGNNQYVQLFIPVANGVRTDEIDGVVRGLAGRKLEFVGA